MPLRYWNATRIKWTPRRKAEFVRDWNAGLARSELITKYEARKPEDIAVWLRRLGHTLVERGRKVSTGASEQRQA